MWSFSFTPRGGTPPYTFSLAPGATNWPGFQVSNAPNVPNYFTPQQTGSISGIPPFGVTTNTPFTTQLQLTDCAGNTVTHPVTIRFSPVDFNVQWVPQYISEGQPFSLPLSGIGGMPPYRISITSGSLPPGIAFNAANNTLAGTAAAGSAGSYPFQFEITDSRGSSVSLGTTFTVLPLFIPPPAQAPQYIYNAKVGQAFSVPLTATGGTPPYTFSLDDRDTMPSGVFIEPSGAIAGTPTYQFSHWSFRVHVTDSANPPNAASFEFGMTGQGQSPQALSASSAYPGTNRFTDAARASYETNWLTISGGIPPYTCSVTPGSSLPAGTLLFDYASIDKTYSDPLDCYLIGATMQPGDYTFSIRVTDSALNLADFPVSWHVSAMGLFNEFPPYGSNIAYLGQPYSQALLVAGGTPPYTITPAVPYAVGLSIGTSDPLAVLSGTPLEAGSYTPLEPTIKDSAGNTFNSPGGLAISAGPNILTLGVTSGAIGSGTVGVNYGWNLDMSGPVHFPPYTVSLLPDPRGPNPSSAMLPEGLTLQTTGLDTVDDTNEVAFIGGTPAEAGDFSYLLRVEDANGNIGQREVTMHIGAAGQSIDETANATVTSSPFTYNRATRLFSGTVTVTARALLQAPLFVVLTQLPAGITVTNAQGTLPSGPWGELSTTPIAAGQTISFPVVFSDPTNVRMSFVVKLYAGQPQ